MADSAIIDAGLAHRILDKAIDDNLVSQSAGVRLYMAPDRVDDDDPEAWATWAGSIDLEPHGTSDADDEPQTADFSGVVVLFVKEALTRAPNGNVYAWQSRAAKLKKAIERVRSARDDATTHTVTVDRVRVGSSVDPSGAEGTREGVLTISGTVQRVSGDTIESN